MLTNFVTPASEPESLVSSQQATNYEEVEGLLRLWVKHRVTSAFFVTPGTNPVQQYPPRTLQGRTSPPPPTKFTRRYLKANTRH